MTDFAIGVVHFVGDLARAADFFRQGLRFTLTPVSEGEALVDNGALSIRLRRADEAEPADTLELEVTTRDLTRATELLTNVDGVVRALPDVNLPPDRTERVLECRHGIRLRLVREYTEDELCIIPPLPTSLAWDPETAKLVGVLLKSVPLPFRDSARSTVTRTAEVLTVESGLVRVGKAIALQAMVRATPDFQHVTLHQAMADAGLDANPIFASEGVTVPRE